MCPQCQSPQRGRVWRATGSTVKWLAGAATLISVVVGAHSVNGLYLEWRNKQETIQELVRAAEMLDEAGEYERAWKLYQEALAIEPGSRLARRGQIQVAMRWLRNARLIGKASFRDEITAQLLPVLFRGLASATGREAADLHAHVGFAYYLQFKERPVDGLTRDAQNAEKNYLRALELDPDNLFGHLFLGHWLLFNGGQLEEALPHLRRAVASKQRRALVRRYQISALMNPIARYSSVDFQNPAHVKIVIELIRAMDEIRRSGDPLPDIDVRVRTIRYYGPMGRAAHVALLVDALPAEDHLATFQWLCTGVGPGPGRRLGAYDHQRSYITARLVEATGDRDRAVDRYRDLYAQKGYSEEVAILVDDAIERLTGEVTARALQRTKRKFINDPLGKNDDPWKFHADTLLNFDPLGLPDNFTQAMKYFEQVIDGSLAARASEAVKVFEASRSHIKRIIERRETQRRLAGFTAGYSVTRAKLARRNLLSVWHSLAIYAAKAGQLDKSIVEFGDLLKRAVPDEEIGLEQSNLVSLRRSALYNLACAYSRRSESGSADDSARRSDVAAAISNLRRAIDEGYDTWEQLKADKDLQALRAETEFKDLIRGR
jgi:tetratricopeptide (TPR) repeat protein